LVWRREAVRQGGGGTVSVAGKWWAVGRAGGAGRWMTGRSQTVRGRRQVVEEADHGRGSHDAPRGIGGPFIQGRAPDKEREYRLPIGHILTEGDSTVSCRTFSTNLFRYFVHTLSQDSLQSNRTIREASALFGSILVSKKTGWICLDISF
jgi:hypothetical protein